MSADPNCIFCKIVAGQIPARKAYEDEQMLAFHDIHPWAPVHILIIPKRHLVSMVDVGPEHADLLGRMMVLSSRSDAGTGRHQRLPPCHQHRPDGRQEVQHLHMHVMGGPRPWAKG